MKRYLLLLLAGAVWLLSDLAAQETQPRAPRPEVVPITETPPAGTNLTRFDLDFPGGSPEQLVRAIEKASGRPLNAVIPKGAEEVELPPLRMKGVTAPRLFEALQEASRRTVAYQTGSYTPYEVGAQPVARRTLREEFYGFQTHGTPTDDSVWFFYYDRPAPQTEGSQLTYRFYQLAPYLETYKVEDITTAIQTGYKMLGEKTPPTISFHKDTKLLIAVGDGDKLHLIDDVLKELSGSPKSGKESASPPKAPTPAPPTKVE